MPDIKGNWKHLELDYHKERKAVEAQIENEAVEKWLTDNTVGWFWFEDVQPYLRVESTRLLVWFEKEVDAAAFKLRWM